MAYTSYNPYVNPYYQTQIPQMPAQQMQQPMPQQMPQQPVSTPAQNNQGLIWVSGEIGAKSYLVAPNSSVMLMDSESETFYIKSTDGAGMPTMRTYDYVERKPNMQKGSPQAAKQPERNLSEEFVTRKEYEDLSGKYEEILNRLSELQKPRNTAKKKVEVTENE